MLAQITKLKEASEKERDPSSHINATKYDRIMRSVSIKVGNFIIINNNYYKLKQNE